MSDAQSILSGLHHDLEALDRLGKAIYAATDELVAAEEDWESKLDLVGESLRDDYRELGRKSDPADHTILSTARKLHRTEYQRYRRAKRDLERLQLLSQIRRQQCSGRQSELSALKAESSVPVPSPSWTGGRQVA